MAAFSVRKSYLTERTECKPRNIKMSLHNRLGNYTKTGQRMVAVTHFTLYLKSRYISTPSDLFAFRFHFV